MAGEATSTALEITLWPSIAATGAAVGSTNCTLSDCCSSSGTAASIAGPASESRALHIWAEDVLRCGGRGRRRRGGRFGLGLGLGHDL